MDLYLCLHYFPDEDLELTRTYGIYLKNKQKIVSRKSCQKRVSDIHLHQQLRVIACIGVDHRLEESLLRRLDRPSFWVSSRVCATIICKIKYLFFIFIGHPCFFHSRSLGEPKMNQSLTISSLISCTSSFDDHDVNYVWWVWGRPVWYGGALDNLACSHTLTLYCGFWCRTSV